jgi:glycosyltransferase involved in cell wall biosynthesis
MISVVMATHNRAATITRAVTSVLRQTTSDWELIIVDDGSTDETQDVLRRLAEPRIRIVTHAQNRGVCAAKNTGLDHIFGEWFTTLDSDDEMVPDALEAMQECARRTGATAVTCNCLDFATGKFTGSGPATDGRLTPEAAAKCRGGFWGLTETELLGDLRFDERLPGHEDTVYLKINRRARRYYMHRALLIYHTEGEDRVTKAGRRAGLARKAWAYAALGEDKAYLHELRRVDLVAYFGVYGRVLAARVLSPLLGGRRQES